MNNVDFGNKINRQNEIYQKTLQESRRDHNTEVENLKNTHEYRETKQKDVHSKQLGKVEKGYIKSLDRVKNDQKQELIVKNKQYEKALNKNTDEFHEIKKGNLKNWDKKFKDLKGEFDDNLTQNKSENKLAQDQSKKTYSENLASSKASSEKEIGAFIETTDKSVKDANSQTRTEKLSLLKKHEMVKAEQAKRNFLKNNAIKDSHDDRALQTRRYLTTKDNAERNFKDLTTKTDKRIDTEIIQREAKSNEANVAENRRSNIAFSERYDDLSRKFEKDVRNLDYKKRAEDVSRGETSKEIQDKYKENLRTQIDLQRETQMKERFDVEDAYSKRLRNTVSSYQDTLRERRIDSGARISKVEATLTDINRSDKFKDRQARERTAHDHQVGMKFLNEQNSLKESSARTLTNQKVQSLKENFNKGLKRAQEQSDKSLALTRDAMLADKRILANRLHEQNSEVNANLKNGFQEKIAKISDGYEKRIQGLELQNKLIQTSAHDNVRDMVRKTNVEIARQQKEAQSSARTQVKNEKDTSRQKEMELNRKIQDLQKNFAQKMNDQSLANRKKLKDNQFKADQKRHSEANRYEGIIDQNNKFTAREFQRLKLASETERQRLVIQYEDKIQQLERVYKNRADELEQYNKMTDTEQS
ncbi:MAG: hypothetical protein HON90_11115 [Halobacteriovoraceae bacterium]|nr:hypothetical protein [Halobacteriovoraceae bacterium]